MMKVHSHKYPEPELKRKRLYQGTLMSIQPCTVEGCRHVRHNVGVKAVKAALAEFRKPKLKGTRYDD